MDREELREYVAEAMGAAWDGSYEIPEVYDAAISVVATAIADDLRAQADLVGNMPFGSDANRMIYMADGLYAAALQVRGLIPEDKR